MQFTRVLVLCFVAMTGTSGVQAQTIGQCTNNLINRLADGNGPICDIFEEFIKCAIRIDVRTIGAQNISVARLQATLDTSLSSAGLSCSLNVQDLIDEVLQEVTTQSPVDTPRRFDDAKDIGGCLDAFTYQVSQGTRSICDLAQEYLKCVFRVTDVFRQNLTSQQIQNFENTAETSLLTSGVSCVFDANKALRELRNSSSQQPSTVSQQPTTVSQQPTTVSQQPTTVSQQPTTVSQQPTTVSQQPQTVSRQSPSSQSTTAGRTSRTIQQDNTTEPAIVTAISIISTTEVPTTEVPVTQTQALTTETPTPTTETPTPTTETPTSTPEITTTTMSTPVTQPGFDDANTLSECVDALTFEVSQPSPPVCDVAQDYFKCAVRVTNLHKSDFSRQQIQDLEDRTEASLRSVGFVCDLDAQRVFRELRRNDSQQTTETPTPMTDTPTSTNETPTPTPETRTTTIPTPIPQPVCVNNVPGGCRGLITRDYPACSPLCAEGVYISCVYGNLLTRECPLGWYVSPSGDFFTAKLVYDPAVEQCVNRTPSCPRDLDNQATV